MGNSDECPKFDSNQINYKNRDISRQGGTWGAFAYYSSFEVSGLCEISGPIPGPFPRSITQASEPPVPATCRQRCVDVSNAIREDCPSTKSNVISKGEKLPISAQEFLYERLGGALHFHHSPKEENLALAQEEDVIAEYFRKSGVVGNHDAGQFQLNLETRD